MSETKLLPRSYQNLYYSPTDAYESVNIVYPLTSGQIVVGAQSVKVQFEIPNLLAIKLDDIWIECQMTPNFTSTSGSDTFSSVQPSFVPFRGPSSIERINLTCGSNTVLDYYGNALMNNISMNLMNNTIIRNNYQFMGEDGLFQGTTSPQQMYTRFKLRYYPYDHLNEQGVLPVGRMPKMILSLYFTAASFNMYYAGAAIGTVSLSYALDNLNLQLREIASPTLNKALSNGMSWCSREWYYQTISMSTSAKQSLQIPTSFKYVRGLVFVIRQLSNIQNITPTGINKLVEYDPEVSNIQLLNVKINTIRRQLQDFTSFQWLYELKRMFPSVETCDYFVEPKIGPTPAVPGNTTVRCIYGLLIGNNYTPEVESGIDTGGISSGITLEITWTNNLTNPSILECYILHDRWIAVAANGTTTLIE